ncbi:MAG: hypothetical protein NVS3B20_18960 [Polyangiales bacterium]
MRTGRQLLYASSVGAIGLGARSVLHGPVPFGVAAGAMAAFGAVIMAGVLEPRLAMFAEVINHGIARPGFPRIALTFDDGPHVATTPRVLDLLDEAGVKGTFFVIARKLEGPAVRIARETVARGHALGCHSYAHDRLFAMRGRKRVLADIERALYTLEDTTGIRTTLFRPPIGHTNPTIARVAEDLGLTIIGFSVRGYDGTARAKSPAVAKRIVKGLRDGAIALLHDGAERGDFVPQAIDALPSILTAMRDLRLAGVTVNELMADECVDVPVQENKN